MIRQALLLSALFLFGLSTFSCTYEYQENTSCSITVPDTISFSADVLPLFRTDCSLPDCHSGEFPAGNLNLEDAHAYNELTEEGSGYINTANPTHSILYAQLNSPSDPMPPTGKLEQCRIDLILTWIEQGAKNN
jgi:hypothetical protein